MVVSIEGGIIAVEALPEKLAEEVDAVFEKKILRERQAQPSPRERLERTFFARSRVFVKEAIGMGALRELEIEWCISGGSSGSLWRSLDSEGPKWPSRRYRDAICPGASCLFVKPYRRLTRQ